MSLFSTAAFPSSSHNSPFQRPLGRLFVVEGPDGVGKSTLAAELGRQLASASRPVQNLSFPGSVPGTLGEIVYRIHHDAPTIDPTALQILHVAAHVDLITRSVQPLLQEGTSVVLDRFWWSTFVYARVGNCNMDVVQAALEAENFAWGEIEPTLIVLLDRAEPFRPEHGAATFAALRAEYISIAQSSTYRVHRTSSNDAPSQLAFDIIKEYIKS